MARGQTLISLLDDLRAECRLSLNPAHNAQVRDGQVKHLRRTQAWLWEDFDWPHILVERQVPLQAGQRLYDPPEGMVIDRITRMEVRYGGRWVPLNPGIGAQEYAQWDSELGQRAWPVQRWRIYEDEQIEVWPIPDQNAEADTLEGTVKVSGIRSLNPLVADDDRCDLDARLIVLYTAAEILAAAGSKDAELKLTNANKLYAKLRGKLVPRRQFRMFGGSGRGDRQVLRGPPTIYYRDSGS
ncbi:MAG: hypothetical protein HYU59_05765 [Magnetospirillum gryphiswaldense]|nr:hypothetical protein [Magnetospirillum gryphiswaldense]